MEVHVRMGVVNLNNQSFTHLLLQSSCTILEYTSLSNHISFLRLVDCMCSPLISFFLSATLAQRRISVS
ncbi:hypothetical protein BDR05DRAFT_955960 [Suillus weaverae]|nr:hypothetical protein BDR05DRAFT_955960 [Suillus weaverae]